MRFILLASVLVALATPRAAHAQFEGEIDLAELRLGDGANEIAFESTWSYGLGADRAVLKLDGGGELEAPIDAFQAQLLYARRLSDFATILGGVRHDFGAGADVSHAAVGFEATLSPWLDGEHYVYVSEQGDLTGAAQFVATIAISDRLALEPRLGLAWSAQRSSVLGVESGVTDLAADIRLRLSLTESLGIHVGILHERLFGATRTVARRAGEDSEATRLLIGTSLRF